MWPTLVLTPLILGKARKIGYCLRFVLKDISKRKGLHASPPPVMQRVRAKRRKGSEDEER
jgi:hypothetical protein